MILFIKDENRGVLLAKIGRKQIKLLLPNEVRGRKEVTKKRAMCKEAIRYKTLSYWFMQT